ncbi:MAG TPA: acetyl CoA synthetase subunit alpha, partial [Candidatus Hydrogenedentes bacterium]|nr:acetyl CoA synthetase subunit alpha [Candidatus Hydrogenedentota bacterium]
MTTIPTLEHPLDAIFRPRAVAVIGASDKAGSVGRAILWNMISSPFGGTVYAINPRRRNVLGIKAYRNIGEVPEPVDLAMVLTPAPTVPGVIGECMSAGVKAAIIISAGFAETGASGRALKEQIRERSGPGRIRIIGPNSLG